MGVFVSTNPSVSESLAPRDRECWLWGGICSLICFSVSGTCKRTGLKVLLRGFSCQVNISLD